MAVDRGLREVTNDAFGSEHVAVGVSEDQHPAERLRRHPSPTWIPPGIAHPCNSGRPKAKFMLETLPSCLITLTGAGPRHSRR